MKAIIPLERAANGKNASPFPRNLLDLLQRASKQTLHLTAAVVIIAWMPALVLSASHGFAQLKWFLQDIAAQSRFFLVIPLLIVAEPPLVAWLEAVALHFVTENLIKKEDCSHFEIAFSSFKHYKSSFVTHVIILILVYAAIASAASYTRTRVFLPWCYANATGSELSLAGSWYLLVSLPILIWLLLRWIWRQILWAQLLFKISRLELQLIPAHPDLTGGLSFVEASLWGYLPFSLAVGTLVAGGVANHIVHQHQSLFAFKYAPLPTIAAVVIICVGPLLVLVGTLMRAKRRGIFEYGSLATRLGHQFEHKWLVASQKVDEDALDVQDFSATTDLYQVVGNIYGMNFLPVGVRSVSRLIVATMIPAIPVALISVPFDVLMKNVIKLLA
ncbi:MAG TPA: hypothetical protein VGG46_11580 [Terriglobales bacterium]|jgi:hypothetical protein